jgi:hypothetical protein
MDWGKRNWKLCYKATRDGFSVKTFRSLCSNKGETITIIKSSNGYVFGGYTPIPWDSSNTYKFNSKTFLFSMKNPGGTGPQKLENNGPSHSNQYSTYQGAGYGFDCFFNFFSPTFGGGHDLHICDNSNTNEGSYSNLGFAFSLPEYTYNTTQIQNYFTGSYNFTTSEIEVYL